MSDSKEFKIEDLDIEILKILSVDGRKNKSSIAEELNRSPNTIIKHIQKLEEHKVIKNYEVQLDYEKLGYNIIAIIELTISKGKMLDVENKIAKIPNIFGVYDITGTYGIYGAISEVELSLTSLKTSLEIVGYGFSSLKDATASANSGVPSVAVVRFSCLITMASTGAVLITCI